MDKKLQEKNALSYFITAILYFSSVLKAAYIKPLSAATKTKTDDPCFLHGMLKHKNV